MITYKIDIIKALKDAGYNSTKILKENLLSQSTMQKLRTGVMVNTSSLDQICNLLQRDVCDLIEWKKTSE